MDVSLTTWDAKHFVEILWIKSNWRSAVSQDDAMLFHIHLGHEELAEHEIDFLNHGDMQYTLKANLLNQESFVIDNAATTSVTF